MIDTGSIFSMYRSSPKVDVQGKGESSSQNECVALSGRTQAKHSAAAARPESAVVPNWKIFNKHSNVLNPYYYT